MKKNKRKNVLFITADQWRGDTLGMLGHLVKTPVLDQLAREGNLFRKHYTQAVPCGPSRASLYTGLYAMNHRSIDNGTPLNNRFTNIAKEARKAGYDPTLFGYTDTSVDPYDIARADPILTTYEGLIPGMSSGVTLTEDQRPWIADLKSKGYSRNLDRYSVFEPVPDFPDSKDRGASFSPPVYSDADSSVAFLTNEMLKWLSVHEDQNWFAHLSYLRPHPPWIASEPYHSMYDPEEVPKPIRRNSLEEETQQHPLLQVLHQVIKCSDFFHDQSDALASQMEDRDLLQARATYYGLMSEVDHHLGRVLDYLKKTGQYESTLIVFTSDHGESLGDHYLFDKVGYFDQPFHIPLIIRDPFAQHENRNQQIDVFSEAIDVMPTILDWLDAEIPEECDGSSLMPLLSGNVPSNWRQEVHWEFDFRRIGSYQPYIQQIYGLTPDQCCLTVIRDNRFKYVHLTAFEPLLFDLQKDPGEFENLAQSPEYQSIVLEYAQKMLSWKMLHHDRTYVNINMGTGKFMHWKGPRIFEK